jgi:hypothetical protein
MNKFERQAAREMAVSFAEFAAGGVLGGLAIAAFVYLSHKAGASELQTVAILGFLIIFLLLGDTLYKMWKGKARDLQYAEERLAIAARDKAERQARQAEWEKKING